ncbi:hypothetical protein [Stenotrophomonas phage c9-N]|nr:hypothetical protein [Stenotrophomonas phage c9-N]
MTTAQHIAAGTVCIIVLVCFIHYILGQEMNNHE